MIILILVGSFVFLRFRVEQLVRPYVYSSNQALPQGQVGVVLGAQVKINGLPSLALSSRLDQAVKLYKQGTLTHLIMSGDGSTPYYNEVESMKEYAISQGVPASAISLDAQGLRTYDSCYRLISEYGLTHVVIISQNSHVKRAVYICRSLGLDAIGDATADAWWPHNIPFYIREQAALVLAVIDVTIIHPTPGQGSK